MDDQALHHLRFAQARLDMRLGPDAKILDFGCGQGRSVARLRDLGFDAYGVDVVDHWNTFDSVPSAVQDKLFVIAPGGRLPFPDAHFDFCFSDQVFEHVFDYVSIFREIIRVLKPNTVSCHRFPGPNRPMESHISVPFPWLCYSRTYLTLWALAGRRSRDQELMPWRAVVAHNEYLMSHNSYPTKSRLRQFATAAGATVEFREREEFLFRRADVGSLALAALFPFMSRYMVLKPK